MVNDTLYVGIFFLVFAVVLILYGAILAKTGDRNLMPYTSTHSIHNADEAKRVGRIVIKVGLVIGVIAAIVACFATIAP